MISHKPLLLLVALAFLVGFSGCSIQTSRPDNSGGIYKSTDGGGSFEQKTKIDETTSLSNATILTMKLDPQDSKTIYAGTPSGLYRTTDGAESWQKLQNDFKNVRDVVIHPKDKNTIYIPATLNGTGKIMKTTNGGEEWKEVFTQKSAEGAVFSVAMDYSRPEIIYGGDSGGSIYRSKDGGETWKTLLWDKKGIKKIEIDKVNPDKVYFVTTKTVFHRTDDGGENFTELKGKKLIYNIVSHPYKENVVYISDAEGLSISEDGGVTKKQINTLIRPEEMFSRGIAIEPKNDSIIYFISGKAIYKTVNSGESWAPVHFNIPRTIQTVLIDPNDVNILYLGTRKPIKNSGYKLFPF